ncbi:MFS transporter [Kocuria palustris]|nr:MFS transporter [Kocuria palustris]
MTASFASPTPSINEKHNAAIDVNSVDEDPPQLTTFQSPLTGEKVVADQAFELAQQTGHIEFTKEEDRKLLRKIDLCIQPFMIAVIILQYMDKTTTTAALMLNFREALGMTGDMYPWVASSFYLGYLVFAFVTSRCLQRFPLSKALAVFICLWGIVLTLEAIPNYALFIVWRTALGMFELAVLPGLLFVVGQYYRKEEQLSRTTFFYCMMGLGNILGNSFAYGLFIHQDTYALPAWQVCFITMGPITIAFGIFYYFFMPDTPANAWFLNEREKAMVVERIRDNQQGFGNPQWKWSQFKEAMLDTQTWLMFLFGCCNNIGNGGLQNFSVLLMKGMGFDSRHQILMNMPLGAMQIVGSLVLAYFERLVKLRMTVGTLGAGLYLMGVCMFVYGPNNAVKYAGYVFTPILLFPGACVLSCVVLNAAGHTKKLTLNGVSLLGYCVGNLIGPQTFLTNEEPNYPTGKTTLMVTLSLSVFWMLSLWSLYLYRNWKKEKLVGTEVYEKFKAMDNVEFGDFTDKENPLFRYSW